MFRKLSKRGTVVALAVVAALVVAGAAIAYFTSTGSGSGSGSVGTATAYTVTTSTAGGPLYPGVAASDQTVTVNIKNAGSGQQAVNSYTIAVENSPTSPWTSATTLAPTQPACSASDFALGGQSTAGSYSVTPATPVNLAPNATYTTTVNLHMLDTGVPQDNCQSATPALYVSAS